MGVAQEQYEEMLKSSVWPRLRRLEFKRTKSNFHRAVGVNWQVVNLQRSYYSEAEHVTFTVNLGVAWESVRDAVRWSRWKAGTRPAEYNCHFRERLGFLIGDRDTWWDIYVDTDVSALGDAVGEAIERYGLPWLDERSDELAFLDRSLAELAARPNQDLIVLKRLVETVGPPDALQALEREWNRRPHEDRFAWSKI